MSQKHIEQQTRQQISDFLPDAISRALTSYYRFSRQDAPAEAKEFSAHHSACKVAIAHIELLIKLARWAELPDAESGDANHQVVLAAMMREAQQELKTYRSKSDQYSKQQAGRGNANTVDDDDG
ncbi:MAG: hypothetical protein QF692_02505 [Alphaproteobacteria bacterium]|jgi:hypothetical protein|nr:hypothetical protein [Alphaproteobacteria bacterium]MDP7222115.1 hypothetical protein [Alphaproteobacteria bacterium]